MKKVKTLKVGIIILTVISIGCHTDQKPDQKMKSEPFESVNVEHITAVAPKPESDPNINTFEKWLEKQAGLSCPDIETMVCNIRLMNLNYKPACYLVIAMPDERDPDILSDNRVIGTAFVWSDKDSSTSKEAIASIIETEFKHFAKKCEKTNCIFRKALKVVVEYEQKKHKTLSI